MIFLFFYFRGSAKRKKIKKLNKICASTKKQEKHAELNEQKKIIFHDLHTHID